jgi:predicted porin
MKKTLIALAVLAASGASFAQVTVTGTLITGYKASFNPATSGLSVANQRISAVGNTLLGGLGGNPVGDSSGLGVDTSEITFTAKEDLGGGYSVQAKMQFDGVTRAGVAGGDSSLALTTTVGRLTLQTTNPVDYLSGGISGVGGVGMDNKVFQARTFRDSVGFDTKLGPVYVGLSQSEGGPSQNTATAATKPNTLLGLGRGASGAADTVDQRINSLSVTYVGGALIANVNYLSYDNRDSNGAIANGSVTGGDKSTKDVIRAAGSYDMGSVKLGAGYSYGTQMSGATIVDALVAVSVPVGALTLGANFASGTLSGVSANGTAGLGLAAGGVDGTRSGYGLSATYALSKRTQVIANYASWMSVPVADARSTQTNLLLSHSF